jgi:hypothetical protein
LLLYGGRTETSIREAEMYDALWILIAVLFFALTWGLVRFIERLEEGR